jgi:RNA 2',3'-cyclic 3'-phosphodiesterase
LSPAAGSVEPDERVRLFCALRLPDDTLDRLVEWQRSALAGVAGIRAVPRENLHVTLAFLGSRPVGEVDAVTDELRAAAAGVEPPLLHVGRYRETRSVGMLVCADEGGRASTLARELHARLARLGVYEPEQREWLPHLTVARFRERPRLRLEAPDLGAVAPSDAAVYLSRLRPGGARYEVLAKVVLGGR